MQLKAIRPLDETCMQQTRSRIDQLVKPQGSLGKLETIAIQLAGIYGTVTPQIYKKAVIVMCADHGVCDEQVASAPQVVTWIQSLNIAKGVSGVGALSKMCAAKVYTVDIGVATDEVSPLLYHKKIARGSNNIAKGPAMSYEQALQAIETGIDMVKMAVDEGHNIIATGEMGIGNTTPSTAILCALSERSPDDLVGVGANFPVEKLTHKANVIRTALACNPIESDDPIEVLSKLGGYDIAGMTGIILGGLIHRVPVILDGYISSVAALIATRINPQVKDYIFPSHASDEKSAALASEMLGVRPFIHLDMRLGEGSGAVLAFNILEAACTMVNDMITFEEAGIGVV